MTSRLVTSLSAQSLSFSEMTSRAYAFVLVTKKKPIEFRIMSDINPCVADLNTSRWIMVDAEQAKTYAEAREKLKAKWMKMVTEA